MGTWMNRSWRKPMTRPVLPAIAAWTAWRAKRSQRSRVFAVRGAAADLVARVEVAHDDRNARGFEIRLDPLAQKQADVLELHVAGGVALAWCRLQQVLPGPFRDGDDGVRGPLACAASARPESPVRLPGRRALRGSARSSRPGSRPSPRR